MTDRNAYLVVDAGGTFLKSAVLGVDGSVFRDSSCVAKAFSSSSRDKILGAIKLIIEGGISYIKDKDLSLMGIGMAFPGPFNYNEATPLMEHKFASIKGVDIRQFINETSGLRNDIPVKFRHDANAMLAGELWKGNAQNFQNAAIVTLGTGLGFAFSIDGVVQCNEIGGPAITIFKTSYKDGILEDYVSKRGFTKVYNEITGKDIKGFDVSDIAEMALNGDFDAKKTFHEVSLILSEAIRPILEEKSIECLLFGGQISRSFCLMEETVKSKLKDVSKLRKVTAVKSIENAALLGTLNELIST